MDGTILLADKKTKAWGFALKIQDYIKKRYLTDIPLQEVEWKKFRSREIKPHAPENLRRKEVYFIEDSSLDPQYWWVRLMLVKDLLLRASAGEVNFVLPNLLYSRQDRKDEPHTSISAKVLADTLCPNLDRIITADLHSDQIQGFYPQQCVLDSLRTFPIAVHYIQKHPIGDLSDLVIVSPDVGGVKRVKSFQKKLKVPNPFAIIDKDRPIAGEVDEDKMTLVGDVNNYNVLFVDDIVDSGNSLIAGAKLLRKKGAKQLYFYGTHGLFTLGKKDLLSTFDRLMVSNTNPLPRRALDSRIEVIDTSPLFAEAIYRAHTGKSISELFEMDYNWDI